MTGVTPPGARAQTVDVTATEGTYTSTLPDGFDYALNLLCGDANGNTIVTIADVIMLLNYLFRGGDAPYCEALANANNDTRVNLGDAIYVLQYLFSGGPAPYPERVDCR